MIKKLISKIKNFLNIGRINRVSKIFGEGYYDVQTLEGEELLSVPYYQQYGFASSPTDKTGVIVLSNNGDKTDPVIIADNSNIKLSIENGDTIVWSTGGKTYMHLKNDDESININADTVNILKGDIFVNAGDIYVEDGDVFAKSIAGQVSLYNHTHTAQGPTSETTPPIPTP